MHSLVLLRIYQHTKFEVPGFTNFKDMIVGKILKTGNVTLTTLIMGWSLIRRLALYSTSYEIWRLLLQPFQRYDCGRRN